MEDTCAFFLRDQRITTRRALWLMRHLPSSRLEDLSSGSDCVLASRDMCRFTQVQLREQNKKPWKAAEFDPDKKTSPLSLTSDPLSSQEQSGMAMLTTHKDRAQAPRNSLGFCFRQISLKVSCTRRLSEFRQMLADLSRLRLRWQFCRETTGREGVSCIQTSSMTTHKHVQHAHTYTYTHTHRERERERLGQKNPEVSIVTKNSCFFRYAVFC